LLGLQELTLQTLPIKRQQSPLDEKPIWSRSQILLRQWKELWPALKSAIEFSIPKSARSLPTTKWAMLLSQQPYRGVIRFIRSRSFPEELVLWDTRFNVH